MNMAADRTVVLVGKTGNGKSATGNSILGRKEFTSKRSGKGVTDVTGKAEAKLSDGRIMTVIDTPGLFDLSGHDSKYVGEQIVKCLELSPEGIHAVIIVLSLSGRFSIEEKNAVKYILEFFGSKVSEHMIVLLTNGDQLEDVTIEEYLGKECPEPLKDILVMCDNRYVVFDNKTKVENEITDQRNRLLSLIEDVMRSHGGKPYTHDLLNEEKDGVKFLQNDKSKWENWEDMVARRVKLLLKKVEARFKVTTRYFKDLMEDNDCAIM